MQVIYCDECGTPIDNTAKASVTVKFIRTTNFALGTSIDRLLCIKCGDAMIKKFTKPFKKSRLKV